MIDPIEPFSVYLDLVKVYHITIPPGLYYYFSYIISPSGYGTWWNVKEIIPINISKGQHVGYGLYFTSRDSAEEYLERRRLFHSDNIIEKLMIEVNKATKMAKRHKLTNPKFINALSDMEKVLNSCT